MTKNGPVRNPCQVGGPIHDPLSFYGRADQLTSILERVRRRAATNLVGEARSGKTSVLHQLLNTDVRKQFLPDDNGDVYAYLNPELCLDQASFYRLALLGAEQQCPGLFHTEDYATVNEGVVRSCLRAMLPRHLVLLIDNFEYMCDCGQFHAKFFDFMRGLAEDHSFQLTMVVASRRHLHDLCPSEILRSGFANPFSEVTLGAFTPDEFAEFVQRLSSASGAPLCDFQNEILSLGGYYPYLVQMACSHVFEVWRKRGQLDQDEMADVRRGFMRDAHSYFKSIWDRHLDDSEKVTMALLAAGQQVLEEDIVWELEVKGYLEQGQIISQPFADFILAQARPSVPGVPNLPSREQGIRINQPSGEVYIDGRKLGRQLSPLQYRLLVHLWQHKGAVCSQDDLALVGWDTADGVTDEAVAQQVSRLRQLLGEGRRYIVTVPRWGYKVVDTPEQGRSDSRKNDNPPDVGQNPPA